MDLTKLFQKLSKLPFGRKIFSLLVTFKAPYFGTIAPKVEHLDPGVCRISMRKRRAVFNHIKTVHAIAMCNLCELTMGLAVEAGLSKNLRWIPKTMTTHYLQKATTDLLAVCEIKNMSEWQPGENAVQVRVYDLSQNEVMNVEIVLWISTRPSSKNHK